MLNKIRVRAYSLEAKKKFLDILSYAKINPKYLNKKWMDF
jgi:hypothetical protein